MNFQQLNFEVGFWHPFGPHAGEIPEEIIERKQNEIKKNGWTLWSFQFRNSLELWYQEIVKINPRNVWVFCSEGNGANDTKGDPKNCKYYVPIREVIPIKIPEEIKVPHPTGKRMRGSAFIVRNIILSTFSETPRIEWLRKDGQWQTALLPTRPEYLIKPGEGEPMRRFRAVLELQTPYLAEIRV